MRLFRVVVSVILKYAILIGIRIKRCLNVMVLRGLELIRS